MVRKTLIVLGRMAVLVYIGLGVVLVLTERNSVYLPEYPEPSVFENCAAFGLGAENAEYEGMRMHHKRVSGPNETSRVVVFYHGNAGSACDRSHLAPVFERVGYSYVFVEYPGYAGDAEGPSKKRILAGVPTVQRFLESEGYEEVVLAGESLGVGVAAYHAQLAPPSALILISPHYELADLSGWIGAVYPVRYLMRENYTPGVRLAGFTAPTLLIEATEDELVPPESAERLAAVLSGQKVRVHIPGGHNDLYDSAIFYESIEQFLQRE